MKALLIRVGIDHAYGEWNAPVDPLSNKFTYVPIPEDKNEKFRPSLMRSYREVLPALTAFCDQFSCNLQIDLKFPPHLADYPMHLDPDFQSLTYGDVGDRRGKSIKGMKGGDVLAFYASLRPITKCEHKLIYALIGLYVVEEVVSVQDVPKTRWSENAHTRRAAPRSSDIVVRARKGISGRLEQCIPIGEWRDRAYRVTHSVLEEWGGLSVSNGYIQRSAVPPSFQDPDRFYNWFLEHKIRLLEKNN